MCDGDNINNKNYGLGVINNCTNRYAWYEREGERVRSGSAVYYISPHPKTKHAGILVFCKFQQSVPYDGSHCTSEVRLLSYIIHPPTEQRPMLSSSILSSLFPFQIPQGPKHDAKHKKHTRNNKKLRNYTPIFES